MLSNVHLNSDSNFTENSNLISNKNNNKNKDNKRQKDEKGINKANNGNRDVKAMIIAQKEKNFTKENEQRKKVEKISDSVICKKYVGDETNKNCGITNEEDVVSESHGSRRELDDIAPKAIHKHVNGSGKNGKRDIKDKELIKPYESRNDGDHGKDTLKALKDKDRGVLDSKEIQIEFEKK